MITLTLSIRKVKELLTFLCGMGTKASLPLRVNEPKTWSSSPRKIKSLTSAFLYGVLTHRCRRWYHIIIKIGIPAPITPYFKKDNFFIFFLASPRLLSYTDFFNGEYSSISQEYPPINLEREIFFRWPVNRPRRRTNEYRYSKMVQWAKGIWFY